MTETLEELLDIACQYGAPTVYLNHQKLWHCWIELHTMPGATAKASATHDHRTAAEAVRTAVLNAQEIFDSMAPRPMRRIV